MDTAKEIMERFVAWTKLKIRLHISEDSVLFFHPREIWWASLGVNIGDEEDGKHESFERPVLILRKFNNRICWALPLTTQIKDWGNAKRYYYQFEYQGEQYAVMLSQLRLMSAKRLRRKLRTLPKREFDKVRKALKRLI